MKGGSNASIADVLDRIRQPSPDKPKAATPRTPHNRRSPRILDYKRTGRQKVQEVFEQAGEDVSRGRRVSRLNVSQTVAIGVILCALFAIFSVLWNLPKETQQSISEQIPLLFNISSINHHGTRTQPITHLNLFRSVKKSQKKSRKVSKKSAKKSPKKH